MKRSFIILSAMACMAILSLSSYSSGPAQNAGNVTGSSGSTCGSNGSCHGGNNTNTVVSLTLTDLANNQVVTNGKYTGGHQYKVDITGTNTNNLPKFGFQATVIKTGGGLGGSFTTAQSGTHTAAAGGLTVVEHNTPLTKTGGTYNASFTWTAPAAGAGMLHMYVELNAVNGDNATSGDQPNGTHLMLTEHTTGVEQVTKNFDVQLFPNPAADLLHLRTADALPGNYKATILDVTGKQQWSGNVVIAQGGAEIPVAGLPGGIYYLQIGNEAVRQQVSFVKY